MSAAIGLIGGSFLARAANWFASSRGGQFTSSVLHNPFVKSGQFGIGYTGGSYLGYSSTNIIDPFGLHRRHKYKGSAQSIIKMPYGRSYYGRRRYYRRRRYSRYGRRRYYRSYRRYY